jgi:hypothetical protein
MVGSMMPGSIASITVSTPDAREATVRSLHDWLTGDGELAVRLVESPARDGELGAWADSLAVVLAPGGAAAALAGTLVSWLRRRRSDLTITIRRPDGAETELSVTQLRGLEITDLPAIVGSLQRWLDHSPDNDDGSPAG